MSTLNDPPKVDSTKTLDAEKDVAGRDDLSCGAVSHVDTLEFGNVTDPVLAAKIHLVNEVWADTKQSQLHLTLLIRL